ncbi:hypothetical protein N0V94_007966 [Neodidymelliopsis sp. IMI 364377]|nr:hypothetical protein N0V94_007966 [Neodidymelliopsis sp. IMI 364377]
MPPTTLPTLLPVMPRHRRSIVSNHALNLPSISINSNLPTILAALISKSHSTTTVTPLAAVAIPSTIVEIIDIELGLQILEAPVVKVRNLGATVAGAAAGALGGQAIATRNLDRAKDEHGRLPSRSRSRSRHRKHNDPEHSRDRKSGGGLRARSRSIIDRFRSKSRPRDDVDDRNRRDDRDRHYDSDSRNDSDDRRRRRDRSRDSRRPDHGYKVHEEYDYFTESDSDGDGSPVVQRRKKTTKRRDY